MANPKLANEFMPFENNSNSQQIGNLVIENQTDKIIFYGDIDIYKNQQGKKYALELKNLIDSICKKFEQTSEEELNANANLDQNDNQSDIGNPFL